MAENEKKIKKEKASTTKKDIKNNKTASSKKDSSKKLEKTKVILEEKKEVKELKEKKKNIKQARKQLYYNNSDSDELSKLIKIVLAVTLIIIVFYGVTVVVTNKAKEAAEEKNKQAVEIQYDSIMIGSMLNIDGSYYVLIENDDIRLSEYTTLIQTIKANDDAPTIYTADLGSTFNKSYLGEKSNYDSNMENFKVTGTVLVRVSNHKISNVYDNYDAIIKKLEELD